MKPSRPAAAALAAACAAFAVPATAPAATKDVVMGAPPSVARSFERLKTDANDYFPRTVTVRRGDTVRFRAAGFHTADLPPRGGDPLPLISPTGQKVANAVDAAGAPFWFNGQDQLGFTPELGRSGFGRSFSYDGTERVNSGLPVEDRPRPMRVRFRRTGSFTYFCDVHPGMKGRVRVVNRRRDVPSAASDRRRVARQVRTGLQRAARLADARPPANTFDVGVAGRNGLEYLDFAPKTLTVDRGTTVRFRMSPGTYDLHTATAGPGDPASQPQSVLGLLAASYEGPTIDPAAIYPSERFGTVASFSPALHGNGFWNSGAMDGARSSPLPAASSLRFDTAGSFVFFCLIHPLMRGTVVVQ